MIRFLAHLYKASKDKDGEITLILKVPKSDGVLALNLPDNEVFTVTITKDTTDESHIDTDTGASL